MAHYAIGDIQGCYDSLITLLDKADFSPSRDHLIVLGDLVSRGPKSLEVLQHIRALEGAATVILGNHDLSLMTQICPEPPKPPHPSCEALVNAPEFTDLMLWLCQAQLVHHDAQRKILFSHAGLPPVWSPLEAALHAKEVETCLKIESSRNKLFKKLFKNKPDTWDPTLSGTKRYRCIINYLTRMRFCDREGKLEYETKTGADSAPEGYLPWFLLPRKEPDWKVVFGHWASLGGVTEKEPYINALDTGCVWGGALTLMNIDTFERIKVESRESD